MNEESKNGRVNRLISEKSPYLLQHAHNPVDWYPWGSEAFEEAKKQDKPIFLSIGYSTCHWCHVMEKESFEDPEVARLMNDSFVSIKVDREERPDIDSTYMAICQMMTGSGGWPLTIIMTPDKKPFFSSTYIPREAKFGRLGMKELIPRIRELWNSQREQLVNSAQGIVMRLTKAEYALEASGEEKSGEETLDTAYNSLSAEFDEEHGGFGGAPKFPTPHHLTFLLRYWKRTTYDKALLMVEKTLTSMRLGGIFDQVGFGFHRYSVDSRWFQPHFEKMLYDQATLTMAYAEAYQATKKEEYKRTADEILNFVLRDMTSPQGGFYTSVDADSEGQEGKFYLWRKDEIKQILSPEEAELFSSVFNVQENGNFPDETTYKDTGNNILCMSKSLERTSTDTGIPIRELRERLEAARRKLFSARERRIHPSRDDKILTDLNGLMIAGLAEAAQTFDEPKYSELGKRAADFLLSKMCDSKGKLYHRFKDGEAAIPGFLDDYAFLVWGLTELYEATFETGYLESAIQLTEYTAKHFWDLENGGFYLSADDAEEVIVRKKDAYDGAHPSGNSVATLNLLHLAHMTEKPEFEDRASRVIHTLSGTMSRAPAAYTQLLTALDFAIGPVAEVVIVGDRGAEDMMAMLKALRSSFLPNKVQIFKPTGVEAPKIEELAEFTRDLSSKEDRATAYVCQGYKCSLPTTSVQRMLELLDLKGKSE
ncbi:MAG: thioredoxin domain-containing protein [Promethearchaeati archaeon SRVP18_Atabeyarchaeia-1]